MHTVKIDKSTAKSQGQNKPSVAIVGLGISGLGCAHFLKNDVDLTLYEANDYVGGHTNTVTIDAGSEEVTMDTGFMVYNEDTYPHLTRLFAELGVETKKTSMSFSVNHTPDNLEYNGGKFNQLFGQRKNIFNLKYLKMLLKINKFNSEALLDIENTKLHSLTLREYVEYRGYGEEFLRWYLVPMASAVWSSSMDKVEDFPAITLLRFWCNHGFLAVESRKQWRTVCGGAKQYVDKLIKPLVGDIQLNNPVIAISREGGKIKVESQNEVRFFDQVIMATHADDSLRLLSDATTQEQEVLGAFSYQKNIAIIHKDESFMPKNKRCWASWNYYITPAESANRLVSSTQYWMNSLQGVSDQNNYFVAINPQRSPQSALKTITYHHPLFNLDAIQAQKKVPQLHEQGLNQTQTFFCGAWQRYGFHEDGLLSAVNLCEKLLKKDVWS